MSLHAVPMKLTEAQAFVRAHHRHNRAPAGCLCASDGAELVGVAIVGRPVARKLDDGKTVEITRCCVVDGAPKGTCSFLYQCCWRAARALGWGRAITYTLQSEGGASLRGAGWKVIAELRANDPAMWQSRPKREWHAATGQAKFRWEQSEYLPPRVVGV